MGEEEFFEGLGGEDAGGFELEDGSLEIEETPIDIDGNGVPDASVGVGDLDGDGEIDFARIAVDMSGDGAPELVVTAADTSGDGAVDLVSLSADLDGDGAMDLAATAADVNADGVPDLAAADADLDGDGTSDLSAVVADTDLDGAAEITAVAWGRPDAGTTGLADFASLDPSSYESLSEVFDLEEFPGYEDFYLQHGSPEQDMALWDRQDEPYSCAVATTNSMFRNLGIDPGEDTIAEIFESYGIYDPGQGTVPHLIDDVLNDVAERTGADFHATEVNDFDADDLKSMLAEGNPPLVGVDPCELYADPSVPLSELDYLPSGGHAVMLTGIEETPEGTVVTLNDPDLGPGVQVPLDRFMESADDFGHTAVVLAA